MSKSDQSSRTTNSRKTASTRATVSGPATAEPAATTTDDLTAKAAGTEVLAAKMPFNANKAREYDPKAAIAPHAGASVAADDPILGASTVTEAHDSDKVGSGGLLEDLILREKITHFDHEHIPERIVHARGLLAKAGIPATLPSGAPDPGLLAGAETTASADVFVRPAGDASTVRA